MSVPQKYLSRKDEITADFLRLAEAHINDLVNNRLERRLSTADFARQLFIDSRHLTNTIKLTTGKSPCEIMEERIIEEAQKMLNNTTLAVADISSRFGYNSPASFIKFFKGLTGITPLQYRKTRQAA
ncbi:AraC-type DNA-binding protein [Filimonas lacunae]|uniref:AraC-type DNA-binding protein n=1 Tax=Filimonas lacunae TaxID=477680 RepID=A0A173ME09_9BACT|nr:AraC family transcriptional regulator [Filimonas lacunae]BAV05832.1 transcriptional regulator, AraC family [Filimonas lacunae]SIT28443.1 AraC-type DNA-binding protein [Filimonas lacunae]